MDRTSHKRHVPYCTTRIHPVDQYLMPEVDTRERTCQNGMSHPIYSCNGEISRFLPLDMWPKVNQVHPQIRQSSQPHFQARDRDFAKRLEMEQLDIASQRLAGLYVHQNSYMNY
ncbi:MAG TPA: hypothetical protein PKD85_01695 [Saprospiraceae bacterium]|nr:hypothetical protein [Saprospiraceae bacterium]